MSAATTMNPAGTAMRVHPSDVHRKSPEQLFIDDVTLGNDLARGTLRPRDRHSYYRHDDRRGITACLYGLESLRQAETFFAHKRLERPTDTKFVWRSVSMHVAPADGDDVLDHGFELVHSGERRREHRYSGVARLHDRLVIMDELTVRYVDPDTYRLVRGNEPHSSKDASAPNVVRLPPHEVGRSAHSDVAVGTTATGELEVAASFTSPVFFEHPQDHWPGMVLIDAATQLCNSVVSPDRSMTALECSFVRYGELTSPVSASITCKQDQAHRQICSVSFVQDRQVVSTVSLTFT